MKFWQTAAAILILSAVLYFSLAFIVNAAPTVCAITNGCTGTSTAPSYGQILIGGPNGQYLFVASSTLGGAAPVQSVFGRTGAVTAQSGDYTTSLVPEGSNLYWTQARFDGALTGTTSLPQITTLSNLSLPYSQLTGVPDLTAYLTLANWYATTTDALDEGLNNLYFTNARADARFVAGLAATTSVASITTLPSLSLPYSQLTNIPADVAFSTTSANHWLTTKSTSDLTEGSNLYWTNTRFDNRLSATTSLPNITTLSSLSLPYAQITGAPAPGIEWPWTITTNYGTSTNATSSALGLTQGGLFASSTTARPAIAASSDSTGRALEVVCNSSGPCFWASQFGATGYFLTGIMRGEDVNPWDIAHNPDNPTSVTSFSWANHANNTGNLFQLANNGSGKGVLLSCWQGSDWCERTQSQGYGLFVSANGAGGSLTPFKVASGTATSTILETTSGGNLAIGGTQIISHRLEVGATSTQNTAQINGLSTSGNAPVLALNRSGSVKWTAAAGGTLASDFCISANPNSTYTDASLASTCKLAIKSATGNVGVSSTSPGYKLSVGGDAFVDGNFWLNATGTIKAAYASTTALSATTLCLNGDSCITSWPTGGGSTAWPFTPSSYAGTANQSTTTPFWLNGTQLIASSTLAVNASTTNQYVSDFLTIGTSTPREALTLGANKRISLSTDQDWVYPDHNADLIRLRWLDDEAKPAITWYDATTTTDVATAAIVAHDYLSNPDNRHQHISIETKNRTDNELHTRFEVPWGCDEDECTVKTASGANFTVEADGDFEIDDGDFFHGGILDIFPNRDLGNTTIGARIATTTAGDLRISGLGSNNIEFADSLIITGTTVTHTGTTHVIDSTTLATFAADRGSTSQFGSFVLRTAGTDQWSLQQRNDSTQNVYLRDNVNGVNYITAEQGDDLLFTPADDVGIGTTTPTTKVFVEDTTGPALTLSLNDSSVVVDQETGALNFHINDSNSAYGVASKIANTSAGTSNSFGNLTFWTTSNPSTPATEKMRIESSGAVGVGTTTPIARFHLASTGNLGAEQFLIEETDAATDEGMWRYNAQLGSFTIGALGTNQSTVNSFMAFNRIGTAFEDFSIDESKLFINSSGNVGIATTTPQWPLSVYKTTGQQLSLINGGIGHLFSSHPNGMLVLRRPRPRHLPALRSRSFHSMVRRELRPSAPPPPPRSPEAQPSRPLPSTTLVAQRLSTIQTER